MILPRVFNFEQHSIEAKTLTYDPTCEYFCVSHK